MTTPKNVLLLEDDSDLAEQLRERLALCEYTVLRVTSGLGTDPIERVAATADVLLLASELESRMGSVGVAKLILARREIPVVLLASSNDASVPEALDELPSCYGCIDRNASVRAIDASIRTACSTFAKMKAARESAMRLERTESLAKLGTWRYDPEQSDLWLSNEARRLLEATDIAEPSLEFFLSRFAEDAADVIRAAIKLAVSEGRRFVRDAEIVVPSGARKQIRTYGTTMGAGDSRQLFGTIQDVSEIHLVDRVAKESELTLNQVEQMTHVGHFSVNLTDGSFYHSDEIKRIFGYEPSEYALSVEDAINAYHPDDRDEVTRLFTRAVETGEGYEFDLRVIQPNGDTRYVHSKGYTDRDADGKVSRVYGVFQDVTDIVRTMKLIEQSKMLLRASLESQKDTILLSVDKEYRYLYFNKAHADTMRKVYGVDVEPGMNILECVTSSEDRAAAKTNYDRALRGESHSNTRAYGEGDKRAWFESFFNPVTDDNNEIIGATAMARDISERKRAEVLLQESHNRYHALFEQAGDGIITLDVDGKLLSVNDTFAQMHGYSSAEMLKISLEAMDVSGSTHFEERLRRILAGETLSFEVEHYHRDGHAFSLVVTANLIAVGDDRFIMAIHRDLSQHKRMEEELLKIQKLESLGILAGGIAHDFNNLMGGIFGCIELATSETADEKALEYLNTALEAIDRARSLTGQLLTFSKGGVPVKKLERLAPLLERTATFALSGSNVSCEVSVQHGLWLCNFDRNQISQVVDNIVINAQQATPQGGVVEITAENVRLDEGDSSTLPAGAYVRISVRDHGIGMTRELTSRIFDPFFTTKSKGHGLGLATSYSIMRRHDGCIEVQSEPGTGSLFTLYLPAAPDASSPAGTDRDSRHSGSGDVLVMDDEEVIRNTVGAMLGAIGYTAHCVSHSAEALALFAQRLEAREPFAAVLLDLTIPGGCGGEETLREIRKLDRDVPAFVMSGYAGDTVVADATSRGFTGGIGKPFRLSELADLLNEHLRK